MVSKLMNEIINMDIQPDIFKLFVVVTDHTSGFNAFVNFRSNNTNPNNISSVEVHGDSVEEALQNLKDELLNRFGKCSYCGNYRNE